MKKPFLQISGFTLFCLMILLIPLAALGQADTNSPVVQWPVRLGQQHLFKVSPTLINGQLNGGMLQYETGIGLPKWTLNTSLRYFGGTTADADPSIASHVRLECQPRFYPVTWMHGMYLFPLVNLTSIGSVGAGAGLGVQLLLRKRVAFDLNLSMQNSNGTEPYESPLFLRLQAGVGIALPSLNPVE